MKTKLKVKSKNIIPFSELILEYEISNEIVDVCTDTDSIFVEIEIDKEDLDILKDIMEVAEDDDEDENDEE